MSRRNSDMEEDEPGGYDSLEQQEAELMPRPRPQHQQIIDFLSSQDLPMMQQHPHQAATGATRASNDPAADLFPTKLHHMLHDAERQGFTNVVSWGTDSKKNFRVHDKREFERLVLPKYFKMTKYKSFTRQLHNYEFLWVRSGNDKGGCKSCIGVTSTFLL